MTSHQTAGGEQSPVVTAHPHRPGSPCALLDVRRPTRGEWYIDDDGHFGSLWPPSYRASYDLRWMVEDGAIVGLRFTELGRGSRFDGRYRD